MSLFGWFTDDEGCNNHHFDSWSDVRQYRVKNNNLEKQQVRSCQHEGCSKEKTRWVIARRLCGFELKHFVDKNIDGLRKTWGVQSGESAILRAVRDITDEETYDEVRQRVYGDDDEM